MRSAITLGLGILIAAATPGLRAQVNPSTPNSVKSALGEAGQPAQQAAKPAATKPAPQADKAAGKPTGKHAAKGTAKKPASPSADYTLLGVGKTCYSWLRASGRGKRSETGSP